MLEKSTYYIDACPDICFQYFPKKIVSKTTVGNAQGNQMSMYEHDVKAANVDYYLTERNIYGSSRLGTTRDTINMFLSNTLPSYGVVGNRNYELSNHLGNVLAVINDVIYPIVDHHQNITSYETGLLQVSDYSPFGVQLDGRTISNGDYRYGFQGQEKDDEVKGEGNSVNYKFRMHDPRVGRFFAVDPLTRQYPHYTPYSFSGNKVVHAVELEGLEEKIIILSDDYKGGKRTIELSNSESIRSFVSERNNWSNAFVNFDGAWSENSNYHAFKRIKTANDYLYKGTLTIDLRGGEASASYTLTDNNDESVYIGKNNPKSSLGEDLYDVFPQDLADAAARVHDMGYDKVEAAGISGVLSDKTLAADIALIRTAGKIMDMYKNKEIDPFTNKQITEKTYKRAQTMHGFFTTVVLNKMTDKTNINIEEVQGIVNLMNSIKDVDINKATKRSDFAD